MRKIAVTTFAVLYGMLILYASAERANDWAAREAPLLAHSAPGQKVPCFSKNSETQIWQTKNIEPGFVVESPRESVAAPTDSGHHTVPSLFEYHSTWTGQLFSPRAPPSQI
jgi:hypothetical protein